MESINKYSEQKKLYKVFDGEKVYSSYTKPFDEYQLVAARLFKKILQSDSKIKIYTEIQ